MTHQGDECGLSCLEACPGLLLNRERGAAVPGRATPAPPGLQTMST
eukprot:CAMPEP_0117675310 /NCGR_PEP_ID=MMETSP0804-20121206/15534_1 /TAXON_ID=1074897 /ORGANISM="Tetraselmis astigmatica, Strain CCMP880" /LENGTH=45 /DNA_ID= /DNA_START= /DNA_END= /DNA_ORIENTATION=